MDTFYILISSDYYTKLTPRHTNPYLHTSTNTNLLFLPLSLFHTFHTFKLVTPTLFSDTQWHYAYMHAFHMDTFLQTHTRRQTYKIFTHMHTRIYTHTHFSSSHAHTQAYTVEKCWVEIMSSQKCLSKLWPVEMVSVD